MKSQSHQVGRRLFTASFGERRALRQLLQAIFVAELLKSSRTIWLVSPWVRDIAVLDARLGVFRHLAPDWWGREVRLTEVLARLADRGSQIMLITRPDPMNRAVLDALRSSIGSVPVLKILERETLHAKGLVGDDYCLSGSMNFTWHGVERLDEMLTFDVHPEVVSKTRLELQKEYGTAA